MTYKKSRVVNPKITLSVIACLLVGFFLLGFFYFKSISKPKKTVSEETQQYGLLGPIDYEASIIGMSYENIEGEEDKGIVYRQVVDINAITTQSDIAVVFYFYTSQSSDVYGITAGVEDLAQGLDGQVLFVAINALVEHDLVSGYGIEALPEFVLIKNGARISTFNGFQYEYWSIDDVTNWLYDNGYVVNYDLLS